MYVNSSNTSSSTNEIKILCLKFILEDGTEDDRDYILSMVKNGLDKGAYSTSKRTHYINPSNGQFEARYHIVVTYTHHFKTRHDERSKKILFKLRLKYPDIKMSA